MGLSRSTFYDRPPAALQAGELLRRIGAIYDAFECYGYRRVGAALRHQGIVVNNKRLRRLMREHGLQPKRRRRYVVTTDSDHASPIFPDLAKGVVASRPNQLWVAGEIFEGRELIYKGSHIKLQNTGKIGIVCMGDFDSGWRSVVEGRGYSGDPVKSPMLGALKWISQTLISVFPIKVFGAHKEFSESETCPGTNLLSAVQGKRRGGGT